MQSFRGSKFRNLSKTAKSDKILTIVKLTKKIINSKWQDQAYQINALLIL